MTYHDLVIQPQAKHLVLGTHGRSIYTADISLLQRITSENDMSLIVGDITPIRASRRWGSTGFNSFGKPFEPNVSIQYYAPSEGNVTITVETEDGKELQKFQHEGVRGINVVSYDLTLSTKGKKAMDKGEVKIKKAENGKYYLTKGTYIIRFNTNVTEKNSKLLIN